MKPIVVLGPARQEMIDAAKYYELQASGLGHQFPLSGEPSSPSQPQERKPRNDYRSLILPILHDYDAALADTAPAHGGVSGVNLSHRSLPSAIRRR
jgi:hypothetical protein